MSEKITEGKRNYLNSVQTELQILENNNNSKECPSRPFYISVLEKIKNAFNGTKVDIDTDVNSAAYA